MIYRKYFHKNEFEKTGLEANRLGGASWITFVAMNGENVA